MAKLIRVLVSCFIFSREQQMNAKFWIALIFGLALLSAIFNGNNGGSTSSSSSSYTTNSSDSFNYNYAKNRFKAEGYSDSDSKVAAEAIMKFQKAQENRKR